MEYPIERPTVGYKAVILYGRFRWCIMTIEIPDDATIVHSGNGFFRTDKVIPKRFSPTVYKLAITAKTAHSWFREDFVYTLGQPAETTLDRTNINNDFGEGIHFFTDYYQAVNWAKCNFGESAAV
jgi:hypothetical protein